MQIDTELQKRLNNMCVVAHEAKLGDLLANLEGTVVPSLYEKVQEMQQQIKDLQEFCDSIKQKSFITIDTDNTGEGE